jgi:FkbM family methyltransferase
MFDGPLSLQWSKCGSMNFRQWLKYRIYGWLGRFPYFGTCVHFLKDSSAFRAVCEQGIFESANVRILQGLCRPGSYMFDVGANLGLMAIPVLSLVPSCIVVSFEPSPNSLPFLRRTIAGAGFGERWRLIERAVGATSRKAEFSLSQPAEGLFDGLKSTARVTEVARVTVDVTTLDAEWKNLGRPPVAAIKIDVEGAELDVIRGAGECLKQTRPTILLEWNAINLAAYGNKPELLLQTAQDIGYRLYAMPSLVPIQAVSELNLHMIGTESFLLIPGPVSDAIQRK